MIGRGLICVKKVALGMVILFIGMIILGVDSIIGWINSVRRWLILCCCYNLNIVIILTYIIQSEENFLFVFAGFYLFLWFFYVPSIKY